MLKTNYDTNSKNLNIEVSASLDLDVCQMLFDENIEILQHDGYRTYSVGFYTDSGQLEVPTIKDVLTVKGRTRDIIRFLDKENYCYKENLQGMSREDIISEMLSQLDFCWNDIVREDTLNENGLFEYNISVSRNNKDYEFIETKGYSQGDCATYIVSKKSEYMPSKEDIDNLYWDAPMYMRVTINDIELSEDEVLSGICKNSYDTFNYDKDKVIEKILSLDCVKELNRNDEIKEELEELIPSEIQYD